MILMKPVNRIRRRGSFGRGDENENSWVQIKKLVPEFEPSRNICVFLNLVVVVQSLGHISEKAMAPHSVLLPGKPHGQRSLVGCSP